MRVDTAWFNDLIRRSTYGSQRQIARKMRGRHGKPMDPASMSLMLRGKRAMQIQEARQLADLLDVPLIEILRHAGIALPEEGTRAFPVAGYLDKNLELHMNGKTKETISGPADLPANSVAVRCQTAQSEFDLFDGWVLFAEKPGSFSPSAIGRFCLVSPKRGRPTCGFVLRGYRAGTVNLMVGFFAGPMRPQENVSLDWVSPVIWVRPQQ